MSKELKFNDVAHFYLGCQIRIGDGDKTHTVEKVSAYSVSTGKNKNNVESWFKKSACKPLLIPMEKLTKEHEDIIAKMVSDHGGQKEAVQEFALMNKQLIEWGYNVFNLPESEFIDKTLIIEP